MADLLILLRSILFNVLFFGMTAIASVLVLPFLVLPKPMLVRIAYVWARSTLWLLRLLCRLDYEVRGLEHLPRGTAVVACKHQSAWDTIIMPALLGDPVFVLKKELLGIPLFGWYLRKTGQIPVDRKAGAGALRRLLPAVRAALGENRPILVYPEGTRAAAGTTGTYHPGIAAIYREAGVAVVPVALNSGLYWARRSFRKRPGTVLVEFLEPIPPGMAPRAFMATLRERIETATRRLEAEAAQPAAGK